MLETMVQLAVLKNRKNISGETQYYSEPITIEEFMGWVSKRYGFIINGIGLERFQDADVPMHQAFSHNVNKLKERLREIGFYTMLSDSYYMQKIRPRYPINA